VKPFGFPPVLADEMYVTSTAAVDATLLVDAQHAAIREDA
jgi:hypothetical protein